MIDKLESYREEPEAIENQDVSRRVVPLRLEKPNGDVATISIIGTPHDTPEDTDFILDQLKNVTPERTLFVEQGSPDQPDHVVSQLKRIADMHREIQDDFSQRAGYIWTILEGQENSPFAIASHNFASRGGRVVNMDLSARVDEAALDFIIRESSVEFALERAYCEVKDACFDYQKTIPQILKILFPKILADRIEFACEQLYKTYSGIDCSLDRSEATHDYWTYLREKFMRTVLEQQADSDDIALCHPNHAKRIRIAQKYLVVPNKPENLFVL